jgi:hypothetical protein
MLIHNIPIYGKIPNRFINTIIKLELNTPKYIWNDLKGIYISDYPNECKGQAGLYVANECEYGFIDFDIFYSDGTKEELHLENDDMPCIFIEGGKFVDEYNFAFNIMHEVGHHNKIKEEKFCHKFASYYVNNNIFQKFIHITYAPGKRKCKHRNKLA